MSGQFHNLIHTRNYSDLTFAHVNLSQLHTWYFFNVGKFFEMVNGQTVLKKFFSENIIRKKSQVALVVKNLPVTGDKRDTGLLPGLGRSPGEGNGNPLQYSCLENPTDRGVWWATVHGATNSQTRPKRLSMHACVLRQKRESFKSFRNHWNLDKSHKG